MEHCERSVVFLVADDDKDDQLLIKEVIIEECQCYELYMVDDGQALLDHLRRLGEYADAPCPDVILLDLNMPRKSGFEALLEIKSDPDLVTIPIIIFTTSQEDEDIARSYDTGANTFITKPVTFEGLVRVMKSISGYWCEVATLPPKREKCQD
jgi:CheY-like chemotaxis protein